MRTYEGQHKTAWVSLFIVVENPKACVRCVHADVHPLGHIPGAVLVRFGLKRRGEGLTVIIPIIPPCGTIDCGNSRWIAGGVAPAEVVNENLSSCEGGF
jgi:hypothetical protein